MWPRSRMLFAVRQPISRRCRSSSSTSHGCCGTKRFASSHLTSAAPSAPSSFAEPLRRKSRTSRRGVRREKRRGSGVVTGDLLVGEVRDRAVIIFDDLISTGTTLQRAASRCREAGATRIFAAATHGLFMGRRRPCWPIRCSRVSPSPYGALLPPRSAGSPATLCTLLIQTRRRRNNDSSYGHVTRRL
jgi:hypothetical protein